jgi:hypothetical protein
LSKNNNYNNKKNKQDEKEDKNKNKKEIKKANNENYSSLNNNNNILYNSNNNLKRYYDLGIHDQNKEKKIDKNNIKNNSCRLPIKNENQKKKNLLTKEVKKFMDLKLIKK